MKSLCQKQKNPNILPFYNGSLMFSAHSAACTCKKSNISKTQEDRGLLSNLILKTPLIEIPVLHNFKHNDA